MVQIKVSYLGQVWYWVSVLLDTMISECRRLMLLIPLSSRKVSTIPRKGQ